MKICGISDMHGKLDFNIEKCDILCICGDIVPLSLQTMYADCLGWIVDTFIPWCEKQPCDKVFLIAGNHDWIFMWHPDEMEQLFKDNKKIVYLMDSEAEYVKETEDNYESVRIYGTPWCHQFYNWAFMTSDANLTKIYNKIPYKVDILLTHDCPHGTSDVILQDVPWKTDDHIGCIPLGNAVDEKKPRLQLCGHLHSCSHEPQQRGDTTVINVSMVDEHYERVYEPHYIEI